MNAEYLKYYEWYDVQELICETLNISESDFRDYHKVIGGRNKDLWHLWLDIQDVRNDSYIILNLEDIDGLIEYLVTDHGDWAECMRTPLEKLREYCDDDCMVIHHCW